MRVFRGLLTLIVMAMAVPMVPVVATQSDTVHVSVMVKTEPRGQFQVTGEQCSILNQRRSVARMTIQNVDTDDLLISTSLVGGRLYQSPRGNWCTVTFSDVLPRADMYRVAVDTVAEQVFTLSELQAGFATVTVPMSGSTMSTPMATAFPTPMPTALPTLEPTSTPAEPIARSYEVEILKAADDPRLSLGATCLILDEELDRAYMVFEVDGNPVPEWIEHQTLPVGTIEDRDGALYCIVEISGELDPGIVPDHVQLPVSDSVPGYGRALQDTPLNELSITLGSQYVALPASPYVDQLAPYLPNVSSAYELSVGPTDPYGSATEPDIVTFREYTFPDAPSASAALDMVQQWTVEDWSAGLLIEDTNFREVSIGRLGDDRVAMVDAEFGGTSVLIATIQVDSRLLTVTMSGYEMDIPEYAGPFFEDVVRYRIDSGGSLIPELSDLPIGWQLTFSDSPLDITMWVTMAPPTPAATPLP